MQNNQIDIHELAKILKELSDKQNKLTMPTSIYYEELSKNLYQILKDYHQNPDLKK